MGMMNGFFVGGRRRRLSSREINMIIMFWNCDFFSMGCSGCCVPLISGCFCEICHGREHRLSQQLPFFSFVTRFVILLSL